jgi:RNA:NAD 2'-phosphotransferase (TPT1/KptA family)
MPSETIRMTEKETIKTSKFLSLILRHEPERMAPTLVRY